MEREVDSIIIGAGMYGLYAAQVLVKRGQKVAIIEYEASSFTRASYVNQATYFQKFAHDYDFAVKNKLHKIYGIARRYSKTNGKQFQRFCENVGIPCREVATGHYYKPHLVEQAFLTEEYVLDAKGIRDYFIEELSKSEGCTFQYNGRMREVKIRGNRYELVLEGDKSYIAPQVINATYSSVNQILKTFHQELLPIRYEISEVVLCKVDKAYRDLGLTLMDGPFFSIMPFGYTGYHSLTTVTFTHHKTCHENLPLFRCQRENTACSPNQLANCHTCDARPRSFHRTMEQMAKKYLAMDMGITYQESLYAIKPLLDTSAMDDARPTMIRVDDHSGKGPMLITALSGKINTAYDLEKVI